MTWIIEKQDNEFRIFSDKTLVTIVYDSGLQSESHAKLIAAAPEMLQTLKLIAADFDENSPSDYVRIVNNTINKATGVK